MFIRIFTVSVLLSATFACERPERSFENQITSNGGRLDWSHSNDLIAFDHRREDGVYEVSTIGEDGSERSCLTCDREAIEWIGRDGAPLQVHYKNVGQPAWHPDGSLLAVQVEKQEHETLPLGPFAADPGAGVFNELWLLDADGTRAWQLTEMPSDESGTARGTLHPHFDATGERICWSEIWEPTDLSVPHLYAGAWKLYVADIELGEQPRLANIVEMQPGAATVYECHGFTPDGNGIIFSSPFEEGNGKDRRDIFTLDLETDALVRLTETSFNEHSIFSPDGTRIAYMSKQDNPGDSTDWWVMNADGSEKTRLTNYNTRGHEQFLPGEVTAADLSWSPEGDAIAGYFWRWRIGLGLDEVIVRVEVP